MLILLSLLIYALKHNNGMQLFLYNTTKVWMAQYHNIIIWTALKPAKDILFVNSFWLGGAVWCVDLDQY